MSFPDYVAKFRHKMVQIRSRYRETSRLSIYGEYWINSASTNTSSGPYSTDILYGGDIDKGGQDLRLGHSSVVDGDRVKDGKRDRAEFREQRKSLYSRDSLSSSFEKVSLDKDDRPNPTISSLAKINQFKPNGLRNNLVSKGRGGQDELVAMGTLWSPNVHPKPLRTLSVCTNGNSTTSTAPRRVSSVSVPTGVYRQTLNAPSHQVASKSSANGQDQKYGDPFVGAPPQYQQRLAELSTLEADTVRYERTRKLKKKQPKQDRDS
ncbi:uncharacterized protein LOC135471455 isoform X2 [Liolophura sinensis]|uniref:uncharacterized protein LOC135471455 isoform X2 n=1 Tax=Liolophura sinensis TaxID=3198878 RepID=UPI0031594F57